MIVVKVLPQGGTFVGLTRIEIVASDDGTQPITRPPYEILLTTDTSVPSDSNPSTLVLLSPVRQFTISAPTMLKVVARTATQPYVYSSLVSAYFDITNFIPVKEIASVPDDVINYTLAIDNNGDISYDTAGKYKLVWGVNKTSQDIREVILVARVPPGQVDLTRTMPDFGSDVSLTLGKAIAPDIAVADVRTSVADAINNLIRLQQKTFAPPDEQIKTINSITVAPGTDATSIQFSIRVTTASGHTVQETGVVTSGG